MTSKITILTSILTVVATVIVILLMVLAFVYFRMEARDKKGKDSKELKDRENTPKKSSKNKQYTVDSIMNFMEFDKIEDNMIVQNNGKKYVMVVECQGVNYDLMSEEEKVSVEEGFLQFLNTLTGPVQIYTQTRTINMSSSIQSYKEKVDEIEAAYNKQKAKYEELVKRGNVPNDQLKKEYYELVKQRNLCEYGKDIIFNTEKMSLNRNILNKKYYVALAYYTSELGQENYDKNEIQELVFSELYTKAQAIIRSLAISGVIGKVMSSIELADLLYVAYNRDESETYGMDRALKAGYDELYSTAPDYMDKKIKLLNEEIENKAYEKANEKVIEAQTEKQKQYNQTVDDIDTIIDNLATLMIDENASIIGEDVAESAKEKIKEENKRKEKDKDVQKETKITRRVSSRA